MKTANQTLNFSTCIKGYVVPQNALYGWVKHYYVFNPDTRKLDVYDDAANKWHYGVNVRNCGEIMKFVRRFMSSPDFRPEKVRFCQFKQEQRDELFRAGCRAAAAARRNWEIPEKPELRKVCYEYTPTREHTYSQRAIEGKGYTPNGYGETAAVYEDGVLMYADTGFKRRKDGTVAREADVAHAATTTELSQRNLVNPAVRPEDPNKNWVYMTDGSIKVVTKRDGMKAPLKSEAKKKFDAPHYTETASKDAAAIRAIAEKDRMHQEMLTRENESYLNKKRLEAIRGKAF